MTKRTPRLASRLILAQALVIIVGTLALIVTALLVAPSLFHWHLMHAGVQEPMALKHAEEAFASSFLISAAVGALVAFATAGLVSWFLVRRISRPVEELAVAAETLSAGQYRIDVPSASFSAELQGLSTSFAHMARKLADTDANRSKLLADLAHELRTPLATLEAYIDGLEDEVLQPSADTWTTMHVQVERLRRLAVDVRDVAAAEEHALGLQMTELNFAQVCDAAVAAAMPAYSGKQVALAFTGTQGPPVLVRGDSIRLQQVMANLLENALRHTPAMGSVTVSVTAASPWVTCAVSDDGEGIEHEELPLVFERFHRGDPSRARTDGSGSGLGLTIARAIVSDHGGILTAHSQGRGQGATFTVDLPEIS